MNNVRAKNDSGVIRLGKRKANQLAREGQMPGNNEIIRLSKLFLFEDRGLC
jgi:hypothetical protein